MLQKELHYWGKDLDYMYPRLSEKAYQEHLDGADPSQVIGEAAVWYLRSETAAQELKKFTPEARIIIMLRNPGEAAYSLHSQMVYTGNEPEHNFEKALALESARRDGQSLPDHYYCPVQGLCYTDVYQYSAQVARFIDTFGEDKVLLIPFSRFKQELPATYRSILEFVGVDPEFTTDFNVINANQVTKNEALRDLTLKPSKGAKAIVKTLLPSKPLREKIKQKIWSANSKTAQRKPLSEETKKVLDLHFKADLEQLKAETGIQL